MKVNGGEFKGWIKATIDDMKIYHDERFNRIETKIDRINEGLEDQRARCGIEMGKHEEKISVLSVKTGFIGIITGLVGGLLAAFLGVFQK